MNTNESLILFTLGPVQRFIETARKTEDLWMGSYILSYLNGVAIKTLTADFTRTVEIELIFPALREYDLFDEAQRMKKGLAPLPMLIKYFQLDASARAKLSDEEKVRLQLPTLPNRFLAKTSNIAIPDLESTLQTVTECVQTEFAKMAEYVLNKAFPKWREHPYTQALYERQIKHFLEIYWVIHPFDGTSYQTKYAILDKELGGVKNCRSFAQIPEASRKCSLCGEREVIHFNAFTAETMGQMHHAITQDWETYWTTDVKNIPARKYVGPHEYLCVVCLTKRMGELYFSEELGLDLKGIFPSTSEVATAAFKAAMHTGDSHVKMLQAYQTYLTNIRTLEDNIKEVTGIPKIKPLPKIRQYSAHPAKDIDGEFCFEETLREKTFIKYYTLCDPKKDRKQAELLKKKLQQWGFGDLPKARADLVESQKTRFKTEQDRLVAESKKRELTKQEEERLHTLRLGVGVKPAKYYAVIALDGDNMGEKISDIDNPDSHAKLSEKLQDYASIAQKIVEQDHLGKLVYAGGDDVLALVNLHDLFSVLQKLREKFPPFNDINGLADSISSASAGVCIAHYKIPFGEVLRKARAMEKDAKNLRKIHGKDAVGLTLLKHSGSITNTLVKWQYPEFETMDVAERLRNALKTWLSKRFLYVLREEFQRLLDPNNEQEPDQLGDIMRLELHRLLRRHQHLSGFSEKHQKAAREESEHLAEHLAGLLAYMNETRKFEGFQRFLGFLEICNFVAREA